MEQNKYDDYRKAVATLIEIFSEERAFNTTQRDREFEELVRQVVQEKRPEYFQFFLEYFDFCLEKDVSSADKLSDIYREEKEKNDNKIEKQKRHFPELNKAMEDTFSLTYRTYLFLKKLRMKTNQERHIDQIYFDIFLSHRYKNKFYNLIAFYIMTVFYNQKVYVDWIYDKAMDRDKITQNTIGFLKDRMLASRTLVFFNLDQTTTTNWMAWEVGYYTGIAGNIGILDVNGYCTSSKNVEVMSSNSRLIFEMREGIIDNISRKPLDEWVKEKGRVL